MPAGIKYRLDIDDFIDEGLMKKDNANRMISGLNETATVPIAVTAGGTGSTTFNEGEFITYSSSQQRLVSSGVSLPSTYSKAEMDSFFATKTGGKYQIDYVNVINKPVMKRFNQTFTLINPGASGLTFTSVPHNLGGRPDSWDWVLVCKALNIGGSHNYAIGDEFPINMVRYEAGSSTDPVFSPVVPAAQSTLSCLVTHAADDNTMRFFNKTGTIDDDFTLSWANFILNFDLKVYAVRFA